MTAPAHCTDEVLIAFAETSSEPGEHVMSCKECSEKLDSFRVVLGALDEEPVWNTTPLREAPVPATITSLRAFADGMATEDAAAESHVRALLEGPREEWMSTLRDHPEYRTAGVVRKLIEGVSHAIDTMPPDAVAMTAVATEIADHLPPESYPSDTVARLRGAAWRERAYALFYTGAFSDAETALRASESNLSDCAVNEYELARVGILRALILRGLEKFGPAISEARRSVRVFDSYEESVRSMSARIAEVHLLFSTGDLHAAHAILLELKHKAEKSDDIDSYARVLANLGNCCWRIGGVDDALRYHEAAAVLFAELGNQSESTRERWNVARVLSREGRLNEALARLKAVLRDFDRLGMLASATQVRLDIAEILVTTGEYGDVAIICREAMRQLEEHRLEYTAPALTVLALMKEAAQERTATRELVANVRDYLRRVPTEPNLLFAYLAE